MRPFSFIALLTIFLSCCPFFLVWSAHQPGAFQSGQLFVKVKKADKFSLPVFKDGQLPGADNKPFSSIIRKYGLTAVSKAFRIKAPELDGTYRLYFPDTTKTEELIRELQSLPELVYVERVPRYHISYQPNDLQADQWYLQKIKAPLAWDIDSGSADLTIAIIDNAVSISHEDLLDDRWINPVEIPANGVDEDGNGHPDDVFGYDIADNDSNPNPPFFTNGPFAHGTHVAGIAAASTNNGKGVASLGYHIRYMAVKCAGDNSSGYYLSHAFEGVEYAMQTGADILNLSFVGTAFSITWQNLINVAASQGIICVAAAGNGNTDIPYYPAAYDNVIAVGATDRDDRKSSFSNYGSWVDIMAPSVGIYSTLAGSDTAYGFLSGTSMATPIVSGMVGLMLSVDSSLTLADIQSCMASGAIDIDTLNPGFAGQLGSGRLDAFKTLSCIVIHADFMADHTQVCPGTTVNFTDLSTNSPVSWQWILPGGFPSAAGNQHPVISYNIPGTYDVTLIVSNGTGSDTITKQDYITISTPSGVLSGTHTITSGDSATLRIDLTGKPPWRIIYSDGITPDTIKDILATPHLFELGPGDTTTYFLIAVSDSNCAGIPTGTATINVVPDSIVGSACGLEVASTGKISNLFGDFNGVLDDSDQFGRSMAAIGDLDKDGTDDICVGAVGDDDGGLNTGAIWNLFLNPDGTVKAFQKVGPGQGNFTGVLNNDDNFGAAIASIPDMNGDTIRELAVGVINDDDGGTNRGAVWILFMDADGTIKSSQQISDTAGNFNGVLADGDNFGSALAAMGDMDGNGISELAVGARFDNDGGTARGAVWILYLDTNGKVLSEQKISSTAGNFSGSLDDNDGFGGSLAALGDWDGDGISELAVGATGDDDGGPDRGALWILFPDSMGQVKSHQKISSGNFSGILADGDSFGAAIDVLGDFDQDSIIDIAVGAMNTDDGGNDRGALWTLLMRSDGTVKSAQKISHTDGGFKGILDDSDNFGAAVAGLGDLNNDGYPDLAAGSLLDDDGGSDKGAAWILFLGDTCQQTACCNDTLGAGWAFQTDSANWSQRAEHSSVLFENDLWVIGGSSAALTNDVWSSVNGINWSQQTASASWAARKGHSSLVYDSKIWVIAGELAGSNPTNDVWNSTDGISWTQTAITAFPDRHDHASLVFDNKMWVFGGTDNVQWHDDVWFSTDGTAWTQATAAAGWAGRQGHQAVAWNNKMWIFGGRNGGANYLNDIWSSTDGTTWVQELNTAPWLARFNHSVVTTDSAIWLIGGSVGNFRLNDVWRSKDGVSWTQVKAQSCWSAREGHSSLARKEKIYVFGGQSYGLERDVWITHPCTPEPDCLIPTSHHTIDRNGDDQPAAIKETADGGSILIGTTLRPGGADQDMILIKSDSAGTVQWTRNIGSPGEDIGVGLSAANGYVLLGNTDTLGSGGQDILLAMTDDEGVLQWSKVIGGSQDDLARSVSRTLDKGILISGTTKSFGAGAGFGKTDAYVIKTDSMGNISWTKTFGGTNDETANQIIETADGSLIAVGTTLSFSSGLQDIFVLKLDSLGNLVWNRTIGGLGDDFAYGVAEAIDSGYVITGKTNSFGAGNWDIVLAKISPSGNLDWMMTYGDTSANEGVSVISTTDNGYAILANMDHSVMGQRDLALLKTDGSGTLEWSKAYGSSADEMIDSSRVFRSDLLHQSGDQGFVFAGITNGFGAANENIYRVKTNCHGITACLIADVSLDTSNINPTVTTPVAFSSSGAVSAAGQIQDTMVSIIDSIVCQYDPCGLDASFELSPDSVTCSGSSDSITFTNTSLASAVATYQWFFGTGAVPATSVLPNPPVVHYPQPGSYTLKLIVTDSCGVDSLVRPLIIYPAPLATDAGRDTLICLQQTDSVPIGIHPVANYSYSWSPSLGLSDTALANPLAFPPASTTYTLTSTHMVSGCSASDTVKVQVNTLDVNPNDVMCIKDTFPLLATPGFSYDWSPGDLVSDSSIHNPVTSPDTSTWFFVTATDTLGCKDTDSVLVTVIDLQTQVTADTIICEGEDLQLNVSGGLTFTWSPGASLDDSTASNPVASPQTTTKYYVMAETIEGCQALDSVTVTVQIIQPQVINDLVICKGDTVQISVFDERPGATYDWTPATGISDPALAETNAFPEQTTTYISTITTQEGCQASDSLEISVIRINFSITPDTTICIGESIPLNAEGGLSYDWRPQHSLQNPQSATPLATPDTSTTYTVLLNVVNCKDSASVRITVADLPDVDAGPDQTILDGESAFLEACCGEIYQWWPEEGLDDPGIKNPVASPLENITYHVRVIDINGCEGEDSLSIIIETDIFIPTLFTPDNDGMNDQFKILGAGIDKLHWQIYNRWGELVYETKDVEKATREGWDGTHKGKVQPNGAFVWYLQGKMKDGSNLTFRGKNTGTVVLIK